MGKHHKSYEQTHKLNSQMLLFTRRESKTKTWYYRYRQRNASGYIIRSLKTDNLLLAVKLADDAYQQYTYQERHNLRVGRYGFSSCFVEFMKKQTFSEHRKHSFSTTFGRYMMPFFEDKPIESIIPADFEDYIEWRLNVYNPGGHYFAEVGTAADNYIRKYPAPVTLQMEAQQLRQFLRYCNRKGWLHDVPEITLPPKYARQKGDKRRRKKTRGGLFPRDDYKRMVAFMRHWQEQPTNNPRVFHQRLTLRYYCQIVYGTGLRPGEAYQLTWRMLEWKQSSLNPEEEDLLLSIPHTTKTGARLAIGTNAAARHARTLRSQTIHADDDDFVFSTWEGKSAKMMNRTFTDLLAEWDDGSLAHDQYDNKRTLYSLRHGAITSFLQRGVAIQDVAALVGTGVNHIHSVYYDADLERRASDIAIQYIPKALNTGDGF